MSKRFYKVIDCLQSLICWLHVNFNRRHFRVIREAVIGYPWDYSYLLNLIEAKLDEMGYYFKHSNITEDDLIVSQRIKTMISLIKLVKEDADLYEFSGFNEKEFMEKIEAGVPEITFNSPARYVCLVKVNTKNAARFAKDNLDLSHMLNYPHELYQRKAKKLLFDLMNQWLYCMWN